MTEPLQLLYYCPVSFGGIAEYGNRQCEALAQAGAAVTMLCPSDFPFQSSLYQQVKSLTQDTKPKQSRLKNRILIFKSLLADARILDHFIRRQNFKTVLFASYGEYLAPLWAWRFRAHAKSGVKFGAVAHDPVRDYVVGPIWWHRWSIAEGYSFLNEVFVHEPIQLDTGRPVKNLRTTLVPIGPFSFPAPTKNLEELRKELGIPQDAPLFLSFGHLRDNKNLDLIIEALTVVKEAWLLVAGTEAPSSQKSSADYQKTAESLGVAERCRWRVAFLEANDVSNYFNASDCVLLTYSSSFRSASGVLSVAAWFQKAVIASAGESSLLTLVETYQLGPVIRPDSSEEIVKGMKSIMTTEVSPEWSRYEADNSWEKNAEIIIQSLA